VATGLNFGLSVVAFPPKLDGMEGGWYGSARV